MKLRSIGLIALVLSMVFSSAPQLAFADTELDSLLKLTMQAREYFKVRLSQLDNVPDEISSLYQHSVLETEALANAVAEDDVSSARQHFMSSMSTFKKISYIISTPQSVTPETTPVVLDDERLKIVIDRLERQADKLKAIATKNSIVFDFTEFDRLIQDSRDNLLEGNYDEVRKSIEFARQFLVDVYNSLKDVANKRATDRAKQFAERHVQRLDLQISQAKELGLTQNLIDNLERSKAKLQTISDARLIVNETRRVQDIKLKFEESKVNRINAIIHQLEAKLDLLEKKLQDDIQVVPKVANGQISEMKASEPNIQVNLARELLVKLRQSVSENNLDEAIDTLKLLSGVIDEMEKSLDDDITEMRSSEKEKQKREKPDSKIMQIKLIIQELKQKADRLADELEGNRIAEVWLRHANFLLEDARSQLSESPEKAFRILEKVDSILKRVEQLK